MPENIVDSKFRILEPLPKLAGRSRYRASDLIRGRAAILESAGGEGFERIQGRWKYDWEPALNNRAERFAMLPSFVPVLSVGSWSEGPYYVYAIEDEQQHGLTPARLPNTDQLRMLLRDMHAANAGGDHLLNLRPEYLAWQGDRLVVLPGAWVLPFELLARIGVRSPYQPPELRHAGLFGTTTDGYMLAAVLGAMVDRSGAPAPDWLPAVTRMQVLEPDLRRSVGAIADELRSPVAVRIKDEPVRQSVERISDVRGGAFAPAEAAVLEALDVVLQQLLEGRSAVLAIEGPEDGAGLKDLFVRVRERLAFLTERPRVTWIEPLSAWEPRDLAGDAGQVVLIPEDTPEDEQLLPPGAVPWDRMRPFLGVIGVRRGKERAGHADLAAWVRTWCPADAVLREVSIAGATRPPLVPPTSPAGRHLLDLLCVLEADPTASMLRKALPRQEASLPEAIVELERSGHVRRQLDSGGWWGPEPRLVLRALRPDVLEARRGALGAERREELHLLISHLLEHADSQSLGQRYLRFHHLFAGGNWEEAAAVADALLRAVERRGLDGLARFVQRKLVSSNLVHHIPLPRILELLQRLGSWEVQHGHFAEGQSYFERAADRMFQIADPEAAELDFHALTAMVLAHADLLERRVSSARAMELLQRYIDRFGDRLSASDRGRVFSEQAYCEYSLGRFAQAEERCQVAIKLLDARQDAKDVAQVYNVLGLLRWRTSRYDEAEQYFLACMALREKLADKLGMARIYNNLGIVYRAMHRFPDALEFHHKSITIRQELGDSEGVARNLVNLGWVHFEMGHLEPAEEHAQRAWRTSDELGMPSTRALAKGLLGEIYLLRGRMDEARAALETAIEGARALGDVAELFVNLRRYAGVELRSGRLAEAEERLREAETYLPEAGSPFEEAKWHLTHGELREAQGDLRQAALSFEHAGNNLARLGNGRRAAEVFLTAAELYQRSGVEARARDLAERTRLLFARDGSGITPKRLVDLEVALGTGSAGTAPLAHADRFVEVLCRVTALVATAPAGEPLLEAILQEMRSVAQARHVVLIGTDYLPHRASAISREPGIEPPVIQDFPRLVGRALQTLVPFGAEDLVEDLPPRPFYMLPLAAADHALGCIYVEWDAGTRPLDAAQPVLRAVAQQIALVLEYGAPERRTVEPARAAPAVAVAGAPDDTGLDAIVGRSSARQSMVDFVRHVRDLEQTVLLMGENGTGKEVVARAIHGTGARRDMPFVSINCTAIPESLWERELFGNERGAFTDAHEARKGFFEAAHRGTLLLDEIGDMPWETQAKFLRVLQDKTITRIGGTEAIRVDVRILAATNQDLEAAVSAGRFRRDLYHRLNVLAITLPPLRDRRDDIPELAKHFLKKHATVMGVRPKTLSGEALRILSRYSWPGNIRELEHAMSGALVLSSRDVLAPEDLPVAVLKGRDAEPVGDLSIEEVARWILDHAAYGKHAPLMPALERALAREAVGKWKEKTYAAQVLGISKPTLYTRIK